MSQAKRSLEDLLAIVPPHYDSIPAADSELWQAQLRMTMARIQRESTDTENAVTRRADLDVADVLRTPLPLTPDEANLEFSTPAFNDVFDGAPSDFDPLRAPLKSGEHPQLIVQPRERIAQAGSSTVERRRWTIPSYWVLGGATTLAAAAAVLLYLRTDAKHSVAVKQDPESPPAMVVAAPNQPPAVAVEPPAAVVAANAEANAAYPKLGVAVSTYRTAAAKPAAAKPTRPGADGEDAPSLAGEPPLMPAAGPSELPDHPTMGAIAAALARGRSAAQSCLPEGVRSTQVRLTFAGSGRLKSAVPLGSDLPADARACLSSSLGTARVAPFARTEYEATVAISKP